MMILLVSNFGRSSSVVFDETSALDFPFLELASDGDLLLDFCRLLLDCMLCSVELVEAAGS